MKNCLLLTTILTFTIACSAIKPILYKRPSTNEQDNSSQNKQQKHEQASPAISTKEVPVKAAPKTYQTLTWENTVKVKNYCKKIDRYFKKYKWGKSQCEDFSWHHVRSSYWGNPIIWYVYGDEQEHKINPKNTTLILCGVHGDEITPVKFCFDILKDLKKHPEVIKDKMVVIAPLVTPDSFMRKYPTRYNGRGVDVNRNFPTKDWSKNAIRLWKSRYRSDKRRYPGKKALSEQETIFQVNLIKRYNPDKIISVHAPLTLLDYDGPATKHKHGSLAHQLLIQMSNKAGKYKINNYPFFTGSLGNWAGNERNIPTYTLELPNSDWTKTNKFFDTFRTAIHHAIKKDFTLNDNDKKITENERSQESSDKVL
ncbi:MAG: M14 family zinc carboxypeptidase [Bacteriovoracaceae bacterium]|jgi:protein MpaA|nr:M14 family zinc carboxypeptidase [Bacteriovoracaceae bacterium]